MTLSRRRFIQASAAAAASVPATTFGDQDDRRRAVIPPRVAALERFPGTPVPVGDQERYARIEKARRLMSEHGLGAIVLEPGTSLRYFVDVSWGTSERPFLLVIPAMAFNIRRFRADK